MGRLLFDTGYPSNAVKYHLRALNYNSREVQAMIGLGNAYYELGKLSESIEYYRQALDIDDRNGEVHFNLANAFYLNQQLDEAIKHYQTTHYTLSDVCCECCGGV